jgi:hypothetical protein
MQSKSSVAVKVYPRGAEDPCSTAGPPAAEWSPAPADSWQGRVGAGARSNTVLRTTLRAGTTGLPHFGTPRAPTPWTCGDKCAGGLDG